MITSSEILNKIKEAVEMLNGYRIFKHYKGGIYEYISTTYSTDLEEPVYSYRRLDGPNFNPDIEKYIVYTRSYNDWWTNPSEGVNRFHPVALL